MVKERESDKQLISPCTCGEKNSNIIHFFSPSIGEHMIVIVQHGLNLKVTSSALGCERSSLVKTIINQYSAFFSLHGVLWRLLTPDLSLC